MSLIQGPWKTPDPDDGEPEDRLPIKMPGRSPKKDQPSKELVPQVFEPDEILDEDGPVPVDAPVVPDVRPRWERPAEIAPVIPAWAADRGTRSEVVSWHVHRFWHATLYHGLRSPWYAVRLSLKSPVGAARVAGGASRWASASYLAERIEPVKGDPRAVTSLTLEQSRQAGIRLAVSATVLLGLASGWWLLGRNHVGWDRPLILVLLVAVFGLVADRRSDRPVIGPAVHVEQARKLTADIVMTALGSLGIAELNKALKNGWGARTAFPAPIARDGPGWRAEVDLPHGVTAVDVIERRENLASGLRRALGCVWPEPDPDPQMHAGRLVLWVGDKPMNMAKAPPWPLLKTGQADLFKPVPFGHDQRGREVTVPLIFESVLIGAKPRMGKTVAVRLLNLAAALDPTVQIRAFELKGTGDLSPLEPVAHHYGSGADRETVGECVASLREVYELLESRAKTIKGLDKRVCPDSKVTPELANQRRLGLFPIVFTVDECQEMFTHPDYGEEADRLCTAIIKRGPALGIMLVLATQRPDAKSLPTGVSSNVGVRFCLRVMGQVENDMVLGTSSYKNGIRATAFTKNDRGIGYLVGADDDPQIVRTSYVDGPAAERIVVRARAVREAAGTLSGYALGEQVFDAGPDVSILEDVLAVLGPDEEAIHSTVLAERLAEEWARYEGWDQRTVGAALGAAGVRAKQVKVRGVNLFGVRREWVIEALQGRYGGTPD